MSALSLILSSALPDLSKNLLHLAPEIISEKSSCIMQMSSSMILASAAAWTYLSSFFIFIGHLTSPHPYSS